VQRTSAAKMLASRRPGDRRKLYGRGPRFRVFNPDVTRAWPADRYLA